MKNEQIEIFRTPDGQAIVKVTFKQDTVWLNQEQLSRLFERDRSVIGRHIRNIFKEGELQEQVHPGRSNLGVKLLFEQKLKEMAGTTPSLK